MSLTTNNLTPELRIMLNSVKAPGQYLGGEPNQIVKPDAKTRLALAFPDVYTVGMSHLGLRILYEIANAMEGVAAERVFAPFPDMEQALRANNSILTSLETQTPLHKFGIIGFSLSYEMAATSVLTILQLGGIPLTRFAREQTDQATPLIIAGGAAVMNPEPYSDFIDLFVIGEAEESFPELIRLYQKYNILNKNNRKQFLKEAASLDGIYVPELYNSSVTPEEFIVVSQADGSAIPWPVNRRIAADFASAIQVTRPLVPIHETVHERAVLEIMRGCPNGCRFCQAGYISRPVRERTPESLLTAAKECIKNTGYDEIGLLSLSTSNYSCFDNLLESLDNEFASQGVGISLPSLRVDHALSGIPARIKTVRKSGLTIAPEAGSDRLRQAINKDVTNDNLLAAAREAFKQGWQQIKLYFMIGLPGETDEDVKAIAELANQVAREKRNNRGKPAVNLSVSNFVPKPHTPFQWQGADGLENWQRKQRIIRENVNRKQVAYHGHDGFISLLEAVIARGDRSLGKVILSAWQKGARLDAWSEYFQPTIWEQAFKEHNLSIDKLAEKTISTEAELPWDHIDSGIAKNFLKHELKKSREPLMTSACGDGACPGCGVKNCSFVTF